MTNFRHIEVEGKVFTKFKVYCAQNGLRQREVATAILSEALNDVEYIKKVVRML